MSKSCTWHAGDEAVHPSIGCEYCGNMIATRQCENCRRYFMDWEDSSFDDVVAGPYVSESGDLMCMRCGPFHDEQSRNAEEEEADYFDNEPY